MRFASLQRRPIPEARTCALAPTALGAVVLIAWLTPLAPARGAMQDEIETESITEQGILDPFSARDRDLQAIFDDAERLFRSPEQPDSVPVFDRLIARLESDHARAPLPGELLAMLIQSRSHRAEAHFNLGETDKAAADLERILELQPGWRIDPDMVSPKLVDLVDELRREMVGELLVRVEPIDATVIVDGRPVGVVGQPTPVLAGERQLVITRPGFEAIEESVQIRPDRTATVDHTLERLSAVVRVVVQPMGVAVVLDGEPAQVAARDPMPGEEAAEELAIDGLTPGQHVVELRLAEHRPQRFSVDTPELADYRLGPVVLERMRGELRLAQLPPGAEVSLGGEAASPTRTDGETASFELPPGEYQVEIRQPGVGGFRDRVSVGDQEIVELTVRLQPTLAFLGVLGDDRLAAADLADRLQARFDRLAGWLWSDVSIYAPAVLDAAGLTAAELRRIKGLASRRAAPDWTEIQRSFDGHFGASLYLLAVLGDDLFATSADLWLWSPAPWPAAPGIRTLPLQGEDQALEELAAAFEGEPVPHYLGLGAAFIDADGVVVSHLTSGGAAAGTGLARGDRVASVGGQPVATVRELRERARAYAGSDVVLEIQAQPANRELRLPVRVHPGALGLTDATVVDQIAAAKLALALLRADSTVPRWLLQLNRAAIYLRAMAYEAAVPLLRTIEAPAQPGLGQSMADYWLGSTLLAIDPRMYGAAAQGALEAALQQPGARLYHDDGPLLAPRVRARLAQLRRTLGD